MNFFSNSRYKTLPLITITIIVVSCSKAFDPQNYVERGSQNVFKLGHPEFYVSAFGLYNQQNSPLIRVFLDLNFNSLIFKSYDKKQLASATAFIDIRKIGGDEENVVSDNFELNFDSQNSKLATGKYHNITREYRAEPGLYNVEVTVLDHGSNNSTSITTETYIPKQKGVSPFLTNIQLFGLDLETDNNYKPITTYDIPSKYDSLKFVYQVTNSNKDSGLTIRSDLLKFESDTMPARSMGNSNYSSSSIEYKGIDYNESKLIQSNRRILLQSGSVLFEYKFAVKERGNYRFVATINQETSNLEEKSARRDFSIKSTNYPSLKSPIELARPLYYLMSKKEYEKLLSLESDQALKNEIDRFWLKNIGDKKKTNQVIELYYSRVETANKLYSNFKEGWKTDRGMIYILFGPALYKNKSLNSLQWFYSYNRYNPRKNFSFERPKSVNQFYPFNNYLLQRDFFLNNVEYKQKRLWLTGLILTNPI